VITHVYVFVPPPPILLTISGSAVLTMDPFRAERNDAAIIAA
jgi:hypothetical protein